MGVALIAPEPAPSIATFSSTTMPLRITNIRLAHGRHGPERESPDLRPFDEVVIPFLIEGLHTDATAVVRARMDFQVRDAQGTVLLANSESIHHRLGLGGDVVAASVQVSMSEQRAPGAYTVAVRIMDERTGQTADFERVLRLLPKAWAIVSPRLYLDAERRFPAGSILLAGQTLYYSLKVSGVDRNASRIDALLKVHVLDESGREMEAPTVESVIASEEREVISHAQTIDYEGELPLNRPGRFVLRFVVRDRIGDRNATLDLPLCVHLS